MLFFFLGEGGEDGGVGGVGLGGGAVDCGVVLLGCVVLLGFTGVGDGRGLVGLVAGGLGR